LAVLLFNAAVARAQTFTTLYSSPGGSNGIYPWAGVIQDHLATCTVFGGPAGYYGTVWSYVP